MIYDTKKVHKAMLISKFKNMYDTWNLSYM